MERRDTDFAAYLRSGGASGCPLSDDTVATYLRVAHLFMRHDGKLTKIFRDGLSIATKKKYVAGLRQWASFSGDDQLAAALRRGPGLQQILKLRESSLPVKSEAYTDEEMATFLRSLRVIRGEEPRWIWPCISLQLNLALRSTADLVGLRRDAVEESLNTGRLTLVGKRDRIDQMPARFVREELEELLACTDARWEIVADIISPEAKGLPEWKRRQRAGERYRKVVAKIGRAAGIEGASKTHRFRKWGITRYHREVAQGDIVRTARFARHESIETTRRYIRSVDLDEDDQILTEKKLR